jgi:Ca-activated chloride channel family protein
MKTTAQLTYEKVRFDEAKDVHLVVSLAAPHLDGSAPRAPVCVIPVIDVSGSMQGEKLHFARQSVMKLIDHLAPGDLCGVVTFSTRVETLAAPAEMTQARKDELKGLVGKLEAQDQTNLAGGMLAGLDHAKVTRLAPGTRVRVILFTDGLANQGPATSHEELLALLEANLGTATLSAFGYGADADQELLRDLSTKGKGNYAFIQAPEDALTAFARELGGLLSTYAQDIEVTVTPRPGFVLTDVVSDVDATEERGAVRIRIPELLADEVRNIVLEGRLEARAAPGAGPETVAEVAVSHETFANARPVRGGETLEARCRFVPAADAQEKPTPSVDAVVAVAQLVRAQIEAEEAARRGQYAEAQQVMVLFQREAAGRGHDAVATAADKIAGRMGSAAAYEGSKAYRSSMRKGSSRQVVTSYESEALQDLGAMGQAKTTDAQARMEESFGRKGSKSSRTTTGTARRGLARKRSKRW